MMPNLTGLFFCLAIVAVFAMGEIRSAPADTECTSQDDAICKADKDERMALYAKGRDAYDTARTSGDFTEAFSLSRKLAAKGDKNGERLLRMVYIQLGWGAHRDYVQAYQWMSEGIADGIDYASLWRNKLMDKMTPEQLAQAKKTAGN